MWVAGIDLAWGERRGDGVCLVEVGRGHARVAGYAYPHGDDELLATLAARIPRAVPALLAIDAPIVCPNRTGSRPVDRETHRRFHREHAGCHPANSSRCRRPPRVAARLAELGFAIGHDPTHRPRLMAEVYPHPALVRFLRLPRIVKYKRGPVAARRREFRRLGCLLRCFAARELPFLALDDETRRLLAEPWSKPVEDRVDAFVCALIGLWHLHYEGRWSEVLGDLATGFLLLPAETRPHALATGATPGGEQRLTRTRASRSAPVGGSRAGRPRSAPRR